MVSIMTPFTLQHIVMFTCNFCSHIAAATSDDTAAAAASSTAIEVHGGLPLLHLDLRGVGVIGDGVLGAVVTVCSRLQVLELDYCSGLNGDFLEKLAPGCHSLQVHSPYLRLLVLYSVFSSLV
jgi:hypothetical protein